MGILSVEAIDSTAKVEASDNSEKSSRSVMALVFLVAMAVAGCTKSDNKTKSSKSNIPVAASVISSPGDEEKSDGGPEEEVVGGAGSISGETRYKKGTPPGGYGGLKKSLIIQESASRAVSPAVSPEDVVKEATMAHTFDVNKATERKAAAVQVFTGLERIFRKCPSVVPIKDISDVTAKLFAKQVGAIPMDTPIITPSVIATAPELVPIDIVDGGDNWQAEYVGIELFSEDEIGATCMNNVRHVANVNLRALDCCAGDSGSQVTNSVPSGETSAANRLVMKSIRATVACDKVIDPHAGVCRSGQR